MTVNVLSLDPGETTGYCHGILDGNKFFLAPGQEQLQHHELYKLLTRWTPNHVVCENFEYRPGAARPAMILVSLELIGVVKLWCYLRDMEPAMQKASEGKGYFTNDKLSELGVYTRGIPHGMDALRHLMHWFVFKGGYKYNNEPQLELVEERWLLGAYIDCL